MGVDGVATWRAKPIRDVKGLPRVLIFLTGFVQMTLFLSLTGSHNILVFLLNGRQKATSRAHRRFRVAAVARGRSRCRPRLVALRFCNSSQAVAQQLAQRALLGTAKLLDQISSDVVNPGDSVLSDRSATEPGRGLDVLVKIAELVGMIARELGPWTTKVSCLSHSLRRIEVIGMELSELTSSSVTGLCTHRSM